MCVEKAIRDPLHLTCIHHDVYIHMSRTQIYLEKSQLEALRKQAQKRRLTVSAIIREIIRENLTVKRRPTLKIKHESLLEASDRIGKMGMKGPKDLARNVDKYLYGKDFR